VASIYGFGQLRTEVTYKVVTNAPVVCKYGAGRLHRVIINSNAGTDVTLYDNTAASGTIIAVLTTIEATSLEFNCPFFIGLTAVPSVAAVEVTIIYE